MNKHILQNHIWKPTIIGEFFNLIKKEDNSKFVEIIYRIAKNKLQDIGIKLYAKRRW